MKPISPNKKLPPISSLRKIHVNRLCTISILSKVQKLPCNSLKLHNIKMYKGREFKSLG